MQDLRGGPWGYADILMLLLPIIFLVWSVVKPNPMQSTISLPLSAVLMFLIKLVYLEASSHDTNASVAMGVLQALTPVSIVAGAIFLFDCMESSGCLKWMRTAMKLITDGHPVAEVMLIGWCFHFLVEGASGFGTPAALAAPMLYSMGHSKLDSVCCLLLFNGFSSSFGAVGTPMWFGMTQATGIEGSGLMDIGSRGAIALCVCAVLTPCIVNILVPLADVRRNLVFIYLSTASIMIPVLGISFVSAEFPTILGGLIGMVITTILIVFKVGLKPCEKSHHKEHSREHLGEQKEAEHSKEPHEEAVDVPVADDAHPMQASVTVADIDLDLEAPKTAEEQVIRDEPTGSGTEEGPIISLSADQIEALEHKGCAMVVVPREVAEVAELPVSDRICEIQAASSYHSTHSHNTAQGHQRKVFKVTLKEVIGRTLPLWLTVLLLVLTRIEPIGLKEILTDPEPHTKVDLGSLGDFTLSASGVVGLKDVMRAPEAKAWSYAVFYVPCILPFFIVGSITLLLYRNELQMGPFHILHGVVLRMKRPFIALAGALILVELLRGGDEQVDAPAYIIGVRLSDLLSYGFIALSCATGSLGAFFSGSTTISNLTFGQVQQVAAQNLEVNVDAMLALQVVGAAIGNAVCLSNIISACTVIGLHVPEGEVLKKVFPLLLVFCIISTVVMLPFIFL